MNERQFEDIIEKYPDLLEAGLILKGRQVSIKGKFIDLLFEDRHGQKLIAELKVGPIKREHIGQIMDYEGHLLFPDAPTVRIMLVGNRVPPSFRQSLDYHGIEWREFAYVQLINFLKEKKDTNLLSYFTDSEIKGIQHPGKKEKKSKVFAPAEKWVMDGIEIENEQKARNLFKKIKSEKVLNFLKSLMGLLHKKMEICRAVKHEFKYWPANAKRCSIYIRPFSNKIDIYLETFSPSDINQRNKLKRIPLIVTENIHNPADQFKSVIIISEEWLTDNKDKKNDLLDFLNNLIDDMIQMH